MDAEETLKAILNELKDENKKLVTGQLGLEKFNEKWQKNIKS